jgi:integrase
VPDLARRLPKYRHYKPKDLAVVRIDGRDIYLGRYDSSASHEKYRRVVAEWLARGGAPIPDRPVQLVEAGPTIGEIILAFLTRHAAEHYRHADGTPTGEYGNFRDSLRPLRQLFSRTPAKDFSPKRLKAVRQVMIDAGLSRNVINQRVGRIVHLFKWAVSEELVPPEVHHGLRTVSGLQKGRSTARETEPIKPVPKNYIDAIRPHVARQVWAMVELQRLTGMRPGEVVIMRTSDLDISGKIWEYIPNRHKNEHRGKQRRIILGPKAQAILQPWLRTDLSAYLFSPKEAMAERCAERRRNRRTPMTPSQRARRPKRKPRRTQGDHYSRNPMP